MSKLIIFRIDGNQVYDYAKIGLSYHSTRELAEKKLVDDGFQLETRKWENIAGHQPGSPAKLWYNIPLSEDGYPYDNTKYRVIEEIEVDAEPLKWSGE